jgi:hypothetical protein
MMVSLAFPFCLICAIVSIPLPVKSWSEGEEAFSLGSSQGAGAMVKGKRKGWTDIGLYSR